MKILYVLYAYDHEWGGLQEGAMGDLTWKGKYYVDFAQAA